MARILSENEAGTGECTGVGSSVCLALRAPLQSLSKHWVSGSLGCDKASLRALLVARGTQFVPYFYLAPPLVLTLGTPNDSSQDKVSLFWHPSLSMV